MHTIYTIKNALYIILFSTIFCLHKINGMEEKDTIDKSILFNNQQGIVENAILEEKIFDVYSHGLGQQGDPSTGPVYDYSGQKIKDSSFYGQRNIQQLIDKLKEAGNQEPIQLEGMSMGGGIVLTALGELCKAADNTSHCIERITPKEAQDLINKINQGYIILNVPIFSMQHTQIMVFASRLSSLITVNIIGYCAYYLLEKYNQKNSCFNVTLVLGLALLLYNPLIKKYSTFYDKKIIPWLISENYNPNLNTPLQAAQIIRKHITCPILIHISKNDELLWRSKKDILQLLNALVQNPLNNNNNTNSPTCLLLSGDGTHDQNNNNFNDIKQEFIKNPQSYAPCTTMSQGNNLDSNSSLYDWTLAPESVYINYKEPLFPLISSGIAVAKTISRLWQ